MRFVAHNDIMAATLTRISDHSQLFQAVRFMVYCEALGSIPRGLPRSESLRAMVRSAGKIP